MSGQVCRVQGRLLDRQLYDLVELVDSEVDHALDIRLYVVVDVLVYELFYLRGVRDNLLERRVQGLLQLLFSLFNQICYSVQHAINTV